MDFEWQTRAPGDVTSPFYQLSMQHENEKKRKDYARSIPFPLLTSRSRSAQRLRFAHEETSAFSQRA